MKKIIVSILALVLTFSTAFAADKMYVYAAASLNQAVRDITQGYENDNDGKLKVLTSFASSGVLAKQIANGAPADIFISANKKWVDWLNEKNGLDKSTVSVFAGNSLVLIAEDKFEGEIKDINDILKYIDDTKVAMGDFNHVPAGKYAKEALESLGVWGKLDKKLALYSDVIKTANSVRIGQAKFGIVYKTDAIQSKTRIIYEFPESSHKKIRYYAAVTANKNMDVQAKFIEYLKSEKAKIVLKQYGFKADVSE